MKPTLLAVDFLHLRALFGMSDGTLQVQDWVDDDAPVIQPLYVPWIHLRVPKPPDDASSAYESFTAGWVDLALEHYVGGGFDLWCGCSNGVWYVRR